MIIWLLYIITEAFFQWKSISNGNKPFYLLLFIIRGMASIIHGGLLLDVQYGTWQYPVLLGFQVCSFWILFDLTLNLLRKKPWNYKGATSGWLDKLPYPLWYTFKGLALIGSIFFYIEGLNYWNF